VPTTQTVGAGKDDDGGYSTKINSRTNAEGLPIGIVITPDQAHDVTAVPALMHDIDCDPEHAWRQGLR
jgi:hypothetical protein